VTKLRLASTKKGKWGIRQQAAVVQNLSKDLKKQLAKLQRMEKGMTAEAAEKKTDEPIFFVGERVILKGADYYVVRLPPELVVLEQVKDEKPGLGAT